MFIMLTSLIYLTLKIQKGKFLNNVYAFQCGDIHLIILESEMLEEGSSIGLDRVKTIAQHGDDLWQLWLSP